jgi:hypothetical protein
VTLDSDTSVRAWYDFDKGEGGARVLQHPYEMPSAGGGGMAQGHPLRHAAPIGSVLALTSGALLWCWPGLTVRGARRPRDDR